MWVNVIIILILVLIALKLIRFEHHLKAVRLVLLLVLGVLIYFSMLSFVNSGQFDYSSPKGVFNSIKSYLYWFKDTLVNIWNAGKDSVRTIGYAIRGNPRG